MVDFRIDLNEKTQAIDLSFSIGGLSCTVKVTLTLPLYHLTVTIASTATAQT
jgi:hypothetical protein